MRASHLAVGVVVISLLVVAVATGPVAAQVDESNESTICDGAPGNGDSLVLVLPDDTYVHANEEIALLPGTEADIALCSGGELISTSAWAIGDTIDGVNITNPDESNSNKYSYAITVENVVERTSVEFGPAIDDRKDVATPTVTATPGQVTTARIGGETYRIALNDTQSDEFEDANGSYVGTLTEIRSTATSLNETTQTGRLDATSNTTEGWIADINQTQAVRDNYTELQSALFSSAQGGNANAVTALNGYKEYHNRTLTQATSELKSAEGNIEQQARSTALGVLANFLGVLLVGAVVGGVGGRAATNRVLSKVEDKRRRSSAVDFHPKHLAGQLLLALVVLGGAVALLVTQGLLGPLLAVFGAVIGL